MLLAITIFILVLYVFLGVKKAGFALITMPIVVSFFFIFFASQELLAPAIVSLCMVPATLIPILFMRHEVDIVPWPKTGAKALMRVILTII